MATLAPCPAVQYCNGRIVIEDAHILGMSQLFNTSLLLGQQLFAQHLWLRWRQAVIKRAGAAQMSDMCSADHDLGRHATDVDAGSTDGTALDQRHPSALLNGLDRKSTRLNSSH